MNTRKVKNPTPGAKPMTTNKDPKKKAAKKGTNAVKKPPPLVVAPMDPIEAALANFRLSPDAQYQGATKHSARHDARRKNMEAEFFASLVGPQKDVIKTLATLTSHPNAPGMLVPQLVHECAGEKTLAKRNIVSQTVFFWMSRRVPKRGDIKALQPTSVMGYLRVFFGHMKDTYDWRYDLSRDFNNPGGLCPMLEALFNDRRKADESYGTFRNKAVLNGVTSSTHLDLTVFDEDDTIQHMQKVMVGNGLYWGFRGCQEQVDFSTNMIDKGVFESGHPMAGEEYYAIKDMIDKTNKLTCTNPIIKNNPSSRIPVKSDHGQCLTRLIDKLSPGQLRFFCRPGTVPQLMHFKSMGWKDAAFSPHQPLGINTVRKMMNDACVKLGHPECTGHGFRRLFITTLANDPGVSVVECMAAARHSSVAAQRPYICQNGMSEVARFNALGMNKQE